MIKDKLHVSVSGSNGLKDLLRDTEITKDVANGYASLEKIVLQLQRDAAKKDDDDVILQHIKGLQLVADTLLLFKTEGEADIKAEKVSTP